MNLLVIMTDEQTHRSLGAYGNSLIRSPNLDALAARSVVFDQTYVTQPVCTASRSSLLTGLYPHTNGCTENNIALDHAVAALPEMLDPDRFDFGYVGKWHLGDEVFPQHGFAHWRSIEDGYRGYYRAGLDRSVRSSYDAFLREKGYSPDMETDDGNGAFSRWFASGLPEEHSKAHFVGSESVEFIRNHGDRPFVLVSSFLEPHMPFNGPRNGEYDSVDPPVPVSNRDTLKDKPLKTRLFRHGYRVRGQDGISLQDDSGWRSLIRRYWGLVSMIDHQVGSMLDALEESGVREDTIVVFTSDHGDMMGAHGLVGKCVMFEEAIRVPLLISLPVRWGESDGPPITRKRGPVSQIDLVPTLLELLGADVPASLEGTSLVPELTDCSTRLEDRDVFIEWNGMNSGFGDVLGDTEVFPPWRELADDMTIKAALDDPVRTVITPEGLKYTWSHRGEDMLFDLNHDPSESTNQIKSAARGLINDLRGRIEAWQGQTLDPVVFG